MTGTDEAQPSDPFAGGVRFVFNFGPTVERTQLIEGSGESEYYRELPLPEVPAKTPTYLSMFFQPEVINQDDYDALLAGARIEVINSVADLTEYMKTGEFLDAFYGQVVTAIATYRGTVLKKGTANRETRRRDPRTPEQKIDQALADTAPLTVTLSLEEYEALKQLAEAGLTKPLEDEVLKTEEATVDEYRVDL